MNLTNPAQGDDEAKKLLLLALDKGLAAVLIDYLWAAKQLGLQEWAFEEALGKFDAISSSTVKQYLAENQEQAKRGTVELSLITQLLVGAGYESTMVHGALATLSQVMHGKKIPYSDQAN